MANSHRAPKELAELRGDLSALKLKIVLLEKQEAELGRIEQESDSDEALQMLVKSSEQKCFDISIEAAEKMKSSAWLSGHSLRLQK